MPRPLPDVLLGKVQGKSAWKIRRGRYGFFLLNLYDGHNTEQIVGQGNGTHTCPSSDFHREDILTFWASVHGYVNFRFKYVTPCFSVKKEIPKHIHIRSHLYSNGSLSGTWKVLKYLLNGWINELNTGFLSFNKIINSIICLIIKQNFYIRFGRNSCSAKPIKQNMYVRVSLHAHGCLRFHWAPYILSWFSCEFGNPSIHWTST